MKKIAGTLLLSALLACGNLVFAEEPDCGCEKGGLGLKLGEFVCGFGYKSFNSLPGCNKSLGVGIGVGGEDSRVQMGSGYDMGVMGIGFGLKNPKRTTLTGFSIGYDYGDCRMVWPITEPE
jgi:hypothetical protein